MAIGKATILMNFPEFTSIVALSSSVQWLTTEWHRPTDIIGMYRKFCNATQHSEMRIEA